MWCRAIDGLGEGEYLKLYTNQALDLKNKNVFVDFNGQAEVAVTTGTGTLTGMDSTATYEAAGTGSALVTGTVETEAFTPEGVRNIAITDDNGKTTFHALDMYISGVSFRPSSAGIYYRSVWKCDDMLKAQMENIGVALSLTDMPDGNFATDTDTLYTVIAAKDLNAGKEYNSVLVDNIFKENATDNAERGNTPIYATPYVTLKNGKTFVCSEEFSCRFKRVIQLVDERAYEENKVALEAFYENWKDVMRGWRFKNIGVKN